MKKTTLLLTSFALIGQLASQETGVTEQPQEKNIQVEVGLNTTQFVRQFLLNANAFPTGNPYLVQLKFLGAQRSGIRLGLAGNISNTEQPSNIPFGVSTQSSTTTYNVRLGYERNAQLSTRWSIFYGVDGIFDFNDTRQVTETDLGNGTETKTTVTSNTQQYGGGPLMGIQFNITDNIRIYTESTLYFAHRENKFETRFSGSTPALEPVKTKSSSNNLSLSMPIAIFFAATF
ncbi:MAG: hypothetical protein Salg2KO_02720 [Salibacteraceae bacterium]